VENGAQVVEVLPGSPAAEAGLEVDDVITAVDGEPVTADNPLADQVRAHQPGDEITLTVQRVDEELEITVTLGAASEVQAQTAPGSSLFGGSIQVGFGGATFRYGDDGLEVVRVDGEGPAVDQLEVGDVITAVNGQALNQLDPDDLAQLVVEGGALELAVVRGGEAQTVTRNRTGMAFAQRTHEGATGQMPGLGSSRRVGRGYLGVAPVITAELAGSENLSVQEGALIRRSADSPPLGGFRRGT
jgi:S1-C subfamily serine protease